jgi:hypothetical protein
VGFVGPAQRLEDWNDLDGNTVIAPVDARRRWQEEFGVGLAVTLERPVVSPVAQVRVPKEEQSAPAGGFIAGICAHRPLCMLQHACGVTALEVCNRHYAMDIRVIRPSARRLPDRLDEATVMAITPWSSRAGAGA